MPRFFLKERNEDLIELMDDPACDPDRLTRTYDWFAVLNPWLARWNAVYASDIRPMLRVDRPTRILDIGCGGGDLLRLLGSLAARDGFAVSLHGIDPDERAIMHAVGKDSPVDIDYRTKHSSVLVSEGERFDIVVSNHVLHHLNSGQLRGLLEDSEALSDGLVLHNDIRRDDLAWLSFWPVGWWCRGSFILQDGLLSIRRAWHPDDLEGILPPSWEVVRREPFRSLLIHRKAL